MGRIKTKKCIFTAKNNVTSFDRLRVPSAGITIAD